MSEKQRDLSPKRKARRKAIEQRVEKDACLVQEFYDACYNAWGDAIHHQGRQLPEGHERLDYAAILDCLRNGSFEQVFFVHNGYMGEGRRVIITVQLDGPRFRVEATLSFNTVCQTHDEPAAVRHFDLRRFAGKFELFKWRQVFNY